MVHSRIDSNSTPGMQLDDSTHIPMLPVTSASRKETHLDTSTARGKKFKIIAWSAGVLTILALLAILVIIVRQYSSNEKPNYDFCQSDNSEFGKCVPISKCSEIMLTTEDDKRKCGSDSDVDKICCPHDSIFNNETMMEPSSAFTMADEPVPIERVGLRISDGEIRKFHNHKKCGISHPDRIINGQKANPGEFPFFVALKYKINYEDSESQYKFYCGGSLITGERSETNNAR